MNQPASFDPTQFGMMPDTVVTPLSGGANSQVFLLEEPGYEPVVCKKYFVNPLDSRDRQGTEARALKFLESTEVMGVPRLLRVDPGNNASFLSYVEGKTISISTTENIRSVAEFMGKLIRLSRSKEAEEAGFTPASEAFFSAQGVMRNIDDRLERLAGVGRETTLHEECQRFLQNDLVPEYARFADSCAGKLRSGGMSVGEEIPEMWRILSPSDVGTHNAIERSDGSLVFIDYEFFGWDDPSKTLADFCLHPAMNLPDAMQRVFLGTVVPELERCGYARSRAKALFPLFGIKWCCIILNEFVPREAARREFSGAVHKEEREGILRRQLAKAKAMLDCLEERTEIFSRLLDEV